MRILVISDLPHFVTGGAEQQAAHLIEAWLDAGHEVVCYGRRMGKGPVRLGGHEIKVRRIRTWQGPGRFARGISYALSLALLLCSHRKRFDVVYTRFLAEAAVTVSMLKALRLLSVSLVATPAATGGRGDANFLLTIPCNGRVIRLLDTHCNAINLIAPAMTAELRGLGLSAEHFTYLPNGVATGTEPLRHAPRRHRLLAAGRLTDQKGYDILLDALAQLRARLAPGILRIAGDGPDKQSLQAKAERLGIAHAIDWLGNLEHEAVLAELAETQIFVLSSRYEGFSNAGLEAMERGAALLVTRCGGLDTYIRPDMGWTVPVGDATALAAALDAALDTPPEEVARMGVRNRSLVLEKFDITMVAARHLELFRDLCDHDGGPQGS